MLTRSALPELRGPTCSRPVRHNETVATPSGESTRTVLVALGANLCVAVAKTVAAVTSASPSTSALSARTASSERAKVPAKFSSASDSPAMPENSDAFEPRPKSAHGEFARLFLTTGLVPVGKTQLSEFGLSASAEHPRLGAVRHLAQGSVMGPAQIAREALLTVMHFE